jgi:hypothetical protein
MTPKPKVPPHLFQADPDVPADPIRGLHACRCGLVGKPGDAHHTLPAPVEDVQQRAAGERSEG